MTAEQRIFEQFLKDIKGSDTVKVSVHGIGEVCYNSEVLHKAILESIGAEKNERV